MKKQMITRELTVGLQLEIIIFLINNTVQVKTFIKKKTLGYTKPQPDLLYVDEGRLTTFERRILRRNLKRRPKIMNMNGTLMSSRGKFSMNLI